ncbi:MAG: acetate--CoA ligase family protein, partial [Chloroflexota bacterium]
GRESPARVGDVRPAEVEAVLASQAAGGFLSPEATQAILTAYGIRTPVARLARTAAEAVTWAEELGYPVALKVASPDITHKSEVGGVRLDLGSGVAVAAGFAEMVAQVERARPAAKIDGVTVQPMVAAGQEVIVGALQDPHFGPLVMFGSGGVEVEGLKDVAFALAPLTVAEAEGMLARTWAGRKLAGFRGTPPADRAAVLDVLLRVGQLAADFPQLVEMEVNPLRVLAAGKGVWAVDGRMRVALSSNHPHNDFVDVAGR